MLYPLLVEMPGLEAGRSVWRFTMLMEIEPCKTVDSTIQHGMFSMKNGNLGMSRLGITELVMSTLTEQTIHVPEVSFGRLPPLCSIFYWCIWGCAV